MKIGVWVALLFVLLYHILINATNLVDVSGVYYLHSEEECHLLRHYSDTLVLNKDGSVISNNFTNEATYTVITKFLSKEVTVIFNNGLESTNLIVSFSLFGNPKLRPCINKKSFYIKESSLPPR